jgi:hypothetical protein
MVVSSPVILMGGVACQQVLFAEDTLCDRGTIYTWTVLYILQHNNSWSRETHFKMVEKSPHSSKRRGMTIINYLFNLQFTIKSKYSNLIQLFTSCLIRSWNKNINHQIEIVHNLSNINLLRGAGTLEREQGGRCHLLRVMTRWFVNLAGHRNASRRAILDLLNRLAS